MQGSDWLTTLATVLMTIVGLIGATFAMGMIAARLNADSWESHEDGATLNLDVDRPT